MSNSTAATFASLPITERQLLVKSVLATTKHRIAKRTQRNNKVMGQVTKFVWDSLKTGSRISSTKVVKEAQRIERELQTT